MELFRRALNPQLLVLRSPLEMNSRTAYATLESIPLIWNLCGAFAMGDRYGETD